MDLQKLEGAKYGDIIDDNTPKTATMTRSLVILKQVSLLRMNIILVIKLKFQSVVGIGLNYLTVA
ncbi:uncharacterized protein METZ01_LOCUS101963 [marine metagenome]|uniref:Uncharacterized protein n=1 Tax=marine metagenome TaxID=408172 RepID=A0A381W982_9ZZZZ